MFRYSVNVPTGSVADVYLPRFGANSAVVAETAGPVWRDGAYVPGVQGVNGASLDKDGNVMVNVGSGSFTLTVAV